MHDPFKTASGVQKSGPWDPWLPLVENSRLFAQRGHSGASPKARAAVGTLSTDQPTKTSMPPTLLGTQRGGGNQSSHISPAFSGLLGGKSERAPLVPVAFRLLPRPLTLESRTFLFFGNKPLAKGPPCGARGGGVCVLSPAKPPPVCPAPTHCTVRDGCCWISCATHFTGIAPGHHREGVRGGHCRRWSPTLLPLCLLHWTFPWPIPHPPDVAQKE